MDAIREFNVIVFHDMSTNSEVEGRGYIGGNLKGGSSNWFIKGGSAPASRYDALIVGGNVANNGQTVQVNNGGGVYVGGNSSGVNLNGTDGAGRSGRAVVGGNVTGGSYEGGEMHVGGNVSGGNWNWNNGAYDLHVGGRINAQGINLRNTDKVYVESRGNIYNGGQNWTVVEQPYSAPSVELPVNLPDLLTATSEELSDLAVASGAGGPVTNPKYAHESGLKPYFAADGDKKVTYFNVDASDIKDWQREIVFAALDPDQTLVINVLGKGKLDLNLTAKGDDGVSNSIASQIVWNFAEITQLNVGATLLGQVIAPNASVSLTGSPLEGSIVAKSLTATTEVHLATFTGSFAQGDVVATPVPAALPLMAAGLGALAFVARRRRAA
ncbi:choice-of-anchor A family protein [Albimonas sp. CAU 1670]|uniref:collagen-binding domain-containing protein n=1 Tax=Albimonas sp. CAU 1670 TaxID=3032599 RepID=UPI0023DAD834|nr:collagen-binding domain-containing protein [Albimonas sp. CAU 1670]MDF2231613.1 choice-of-anchor A family protein [Albimonas sp. CAU 1670]